MTLFESAAVCCVLLLFLWQMPKAFIPALARFEKASSEITVMKTARFLDETFTKACQSGDENKIAQWREENKMYAEITYKKEKEKPAGILYRAECNIDGTVYTLSGVMEK